MGIQSAYYLKMSTTDKLCKVCGDKALGYNFNAITCESCKAFFRRNALLKKPFSCPFNSNCEINVVTRRFCQRCRLQKCFDIGMRKEYIMSDEDKMIKRRKIELNRAKRRMSTTLDAPPRKIRHQEQYAATHTVPEHTWPRGNPDRSFVPYTVPPVNFMNPSQVIRRPSPVSPHTFDIGSRFPIMSRSLSSHLPLSNEFQSAFHRSSPVELDAKRQPDRHSSANEIVTFILNNPAETSSLIDRIMPTPTDAIEIITKILNSQSDAIDLIGYLIGHPMDGLQIIGKLMNSPFNAMAVFSKFSNSPTDSLEFIAKIVNSPSEVLQLVRQLMASPENAEEILNKFMNSPAEALRMLNEMVRASMCHSPISVVDDDSDKHRSSVSPPHHRPSPPAYPLDKTQSMPCSRSLANYEILANQMRSYFDSMNHNSLVPNSVVDLTSVTPPMQTRDIHHVPKVHSPSLSEQSRSSPSLYSLPDKSAYVNDAPKPKITINDIEAVIAEAINMEYGITGRSHEIKNRDLNDSESAKLNELIVANKALYMPVDEDLSSLMNDSEAKVIIIILFLFASASLAFSIVHLLLCGYFHLKRISRSEIRSSGHCDMNIFLVDYSSE